MTRFISYETNNKTRTIGGTISSEEARVFSLCERQKSVIRDFGELAYIPMRTIGTVEYGRIVSYIITRYDNFVKKMFIKVEIESNESSESDSVLSIDNIQVIISGIIVENINKRVDSYFIGNNIYIPIDLKKSIPVSGGDLSIKVKFTDDYCGRIIDGELYAKYHNISEDEAARIIQKKFLDWFYKPICKDGTYGLNCLLAQRLCS
jgi:hypothetical protein